MQKLRFDYAWQSGQFAPQVEVEIDDQGNIANVTPHSTNGDAERVDGIAIPGFINVHSHAFQRGMAGLTEHRSAQRDDFWTWRELMYHFLRRLTPDDCYVVARQLYVELLKAGFTSVGEFHYLHNDPVGRPYASKTAMLDPLIAAARDAGIRICALPTLYQRGGFNRELTEGQRRFAITLDDWLELAGDVHRRSTTERGLHSGAAIHSLRAVEMPVAVQASQEIRRRFSGRPIHMHVAEQQREVDDCLANHRRRPVDWALEELQVDKGWCLIHATHIDSVECARLARSKAVVGLCPSTEANLGDGVFPTPPFMEAGGNISIGTDSHMGLDPRAELRLLEYAQRLTQQRRVVLGAEHGSCGAYLCEASWRGGADALGIPAGQIAVGAKADFVVLNESDSILAGLPPNRWLDGFVFCQFGDPILHVMVDGKWVVRDGRHVLQEAACKSFADTVKNILERE